MLRRIAVFVLVACFTVVFPVMMQAQAAPAAPEGVTPGAVFHVQSRLVVLDVVVTDAQGKPVSGLTRNDFAVFEDKQPQTVKFFEQPTVHELPATTKPGAAFNSEDTRGYGQSPVTVLVLDELNTHFADTDFAKRSLREFLTSRPATLNEPTMLVAVGDKKFQLLQNFTRNRAALLAALEAHKASYSWKLELGKGVGPESVERLDLSISALEQIAQSTARIPGRKNLVWVGQGFPSLDPAGISPADSRKITEVLQHVTDTLLDTRVTLYAVDPTSNATGDTEITDPDQLMFARMTGDSTGRLMDPFNQQLDFDRLGPVTGGRVLRGTNDIDQQIAASVEMGEHFYTLGYTPTNTSEADSAFRKITVKCLKPGVSIMTRDGYYAGASARQKSADNVAFDLNNAVMADMLFTALHIRVEPIGNDEYSVHVAAPGLTWSGIDASGEHVAEAEVLGASLSAKNDVLAHTLHTMKATARAAANVHSPSLPADFTISLLRPKGTVRMRFIVRDTSSGSMGSFDLRLPQ
ncbi:MAG: VWA domain-containing protein [Acidobacteriaceae bacterium]|nr:VWA domain-containing protein [Acidobacteriaceae bacterium]